MHRTRAPGSKPVVSRGNFGDGNHHPGTRFAGAATEREFAETGVRDDLVSVGEAPAELIETGGLRADSDGSPAQFAEAGDDRRMRERAPDRVTQATGVDLQRRATLDQGVEDRLVQLRGTLEIGGRH